MIWVVGIIVGLQRVGCVVDVMQGAPRTGRQPIGALETHQPQESRYGL